MPALDKFLKSVRRSKEDATPCTHTSIPIEVNGKESGGGSYIIPTEAMSEFWDLYYQDVFVNNGERRLNEVLRKHGNARFDIDLKYKDLAVQRHMHSIEQVRKFVERWMQEINALVVLPCRVRVLISMKDRPVRRKDKDIMADGVHGIADVGILNAVLDHVRKIVLEDMPEIFGNLQLAEPWEEVYDKSNTGWCVYGSKKPNNLPYRVRHEFVFDSTMDCIVEEQALDYVDFESKLENIKRMSAICDESTLCQFTELGYKVLGRSVHQSNVPEGIRRTARPRNWELDPEEIFAHVENIDNKDCSYDTWYRLGQTLFNLGSHDPDSFFTAWVNWSAKSSKHDADACEKTWCGMNIRQDGPRTGMRTILNMSQASNAARFKQIQDDSIFRLVRVAVETTTDYDIARIMYRMYSDRFRCAGGNSRASIWYEFTGHTWEESDEYRVRKHMSTDVFELIHSKSNFFWDQVPSDDDWDDDVSTARKDKDKHKSPEQKKAEGQLRNLAKVLAKLKTSGAKNSILRECCELFYESGFMDKLDKNPDLLGCANGVLDLKTMTFRPGVPEDYVGKSTGLIYDPSKPWTELPHADDVAKFLKDILPDEEVRTYAIKWLCNSLCGSYEEQKIHICTGRGKNGKSKLFTLLQHALGQYYVKLPITLFTRKRGGVGAANPELMTLKGARFGMAEEADEGDSLNMGQLKEITGEMIAARQLYGVIQHFKMQAKIALQCNDKPKVNDNSDGAWRRLVVILFPNKFVSGDGPLGPNELPADPSIERKIPKWGAAMLAMLIQTLVNNGGLFDISSPPVKVMEYSEEYRQQNDSMAKFIADCLVDNLTEDGPAITLSALRSTFNAWKDLNKPTYNLLTFEHVQKRVEEVYGKKPAKGWKTFSIRSMDDE